MKPLITVPGTAGIVTAALSAAGCAHPTANPAPGAPPPEPATTVAATACAVPSHAVSYSAQLELPFGKSIKHLGGIALDASGNSYATDLHYGQVWKHSPGIQDDVLSSQLGQATSVAVDDTHNLYVVDEFNNRVLKLPAGTDSPTVLPFNDLQLA